MNDENSYKLSKSGGDSQDDKKDAEAEPQLAGADLDQYVVLTSYTKVAEAQLFQSLLSQSGIECYLENEHIVGLHFLWSNAVGGVKLLVAREQRDAATKLLDEVTLSSEAADLGDITFECEECGKEITFPGERRGLTETCPKCHEYVDVPE